MSENQRSNLETAEVLQIILDSIGDAVLVALKDGWLMKMNPAAVKIFGRTLREAPLAEWLSLGEFSLPDEVTPLPAEEGPLVRAIRGDSFDNLELFIRNRRVPAGIFVSINGRPMRNSSNEVIGAVAVLRDITEQKRNAEIQETLIRQYAAALSEVKTLSGLLPICAKCKKIRDDQGYWKQIEHYISQHTEAEFSHCICPACAVDLYPGIFPKG
jgi:hypothetical protein